MALLDVEMPGLDGIAAATALARELPSCRVIILTTFGRPGYLRRAMESGAGGCSWPTARCGNYLSSAIAKTGSRNRLEAMRVADARGWL